MTIFCMFPGQASQFVGMGKDLYTEFPLVKSFFDRASSRLGFDLAELCFEDPKSQLALTQFTQPALLTLSTAVWFLHLEKNEAKDVIFAGHSLGEYSALVAAEVISFEEAVSLVHKRGQLMQEAVAPGEGGMSALLFKKGTAGAVESQAICREVSEKSQSCLVPANYNSPEQVVVSGTKVALGFLSENYKNYSCIRKVVPLEVSAPFHLSLIHI